MADEKISQLDAVTDVLDDDDYVLARAGASKRITGASLKADLGGSSSVIGTSYLTCDVPVSVTGITMGTTHAIVWTQESQAGADISLRAGGAVVDIATTGWYAVFVSAGFLGALNQTQLAINALGNIGDGGLNSQDTYLSQDPTVGAYDLTFSAPCVKFTAPDTITIAVFADNTGSVGTYTSENTPTALSVVRLA